MLNNLVTVSMFDIVRKSRSKLCLNLPDTKQILRTFLIKTYVSYFYFSTRDHPELALHHVRDIC